jgi:outer membrane protein assembly factor BamB
MKATRALFCGIIVSTLVAAKADDWPQWRGPKRDGISHETGLLKEWPKDGPKLLWQVNEIGSGYSTPSIVADRIYVMANEGSDKEFVQALTVKDGTRLWSTPVGKVGPNDPGMNYPGARSTPTADGDLLYCLGSDGDLACVEAATGKMRWQKSFKNDFGGHHGKWAYAESPLVDGDKVVCTPGGKDATIVALDKKTGSTIWKMAAPEAEEAAYASPVLAEIGGVKQYVLFLAKALVGVDAASGKTLWRYEQTAKGSPANIPTPVVDKDIVYSGAGRTGGGLIKVKKSDGGFSVEPIAFTPKLPTAIGGAVKVGDFLYGTTGRALVCADFATGALKWEESAIGAASILYADGRLYMHGENGQVALAEATADGYHEKGRFTPANSPDRGRSKAWAYPAVANGRLYIRDLGSLWCYDIKSP